MINLSCKRLNMEKFYKKSKIKIGFSDVFSGGEFHTTPHLTSK